MFMLDQMVSYYLHIWFKGIHSKLTLMDALGSTFIPCHSGTHFSDKHLDGKMFY